MFKNTAHRNFEWFEASFTKKLQQIIDESNRDNASWIRDLFISVLLTILPLAFELIINQPVVNLQTSSTDTTEMIQTVCSLGTIFSLIGLAVWIIHCIWKYNKAVQKFKKRVVPHTIKGTYTIDESVHYFDNEVCNDLILSKHYISLALCEKDPAAKEFYLIEALHYYYKSIRIFNIVCNSHTSDGLQNLFVRNHAGTHKRIDIVRLINYFTLIKSIQIPFDSNTDLSIYQRVIEYNKSFDLIVSTLDSTYANLQHLFSDVYCFAQANKELIKIMENVNAHVSSQQNATT